MKSKIVVSLEVDFNVNTTQGQMNYFFAMVAEELKYKAADMINERKDNGFIKTSILRVKLK